MSGALVKICGLSRPQDIVYCNEAQPDYIGFILNFPQSRRNIASAEAAALRRKLSPSIRAVGVFVDCPPEVTAQIAEAVELDVIQLHGTENESYISRLRTLTDKPVWKAFRINSPKDLCAVRLSSADEILLDSGAGTGQVFDWSLAEDVGRPFLLAGGLTPENIPEAVARLGPKLVDLSSGVETDGVKDPKKILAAVRAVRNAS